METSKTRLTDDILSALRDEFGNTGEAVPVSFRQLIPQISSAERATHLIHPYPAKLLRHIPFFFLTSQVLAPQSSTVLDPFCGSGTVLLEATLANMEGIGADTNPLARLMTSVKMNPVDTHKVRQVSRKIARTRTGSAPIPQSTIDLEYWYSKRHLTELAHLLRRINSVKDEGLRNFFLVAFSVCARKMSLADPRVSVPVRLNPERYSAEHQFRKAAERRLAWLSSATASDEFLSVCDLNAKRIDALLSMAPWTKTPQIYDDARSVSFGERSKADLIITSPPYVGAQKYMRSSSLSLAWMGYSQGASFQSLESTSIGREHAPVNDYRHVRLCAGSEEANTVLGRVRSKNPLRAHIAAVYLTEMQEALKASVDALKPEGHIVLVAGTNQVAGEHFATYQFLNDILHSIGMVQTLELVDSIRSRGLMTKRNRTSSLIENERISIFRKL